MNPDEIDAARLQDARDDSDPGPDIFGALVEYHKALGPCDIPGCPFCVPDPGPEPITLGGGWDGGEVNIHEDDIDPVTGELLPSWRDKWDTEAEFRGER